MTDNERKPFAPPAPAPTFANEQSDEGNGQMAGVPTFNPEPPQAPQHIQAPCETPQTTDPQKKSDVPKGLPTELKVSVPPRPNAKKPDPPKEPEPPIDPPGARDEEPQEEAVRSLEPAAPSEPAAAPDLHIVRETVRDFTHVGPSIGTDKTVAAHLVQKTDPYAVIFKTLLRHTPKDTEDVSNHPLWLARLLFEMPRIMRGEQTELIYEAPVDLMGTFLIFLRELRPYVRKDREAHENIRTTMDIIQSRLTEKRIQDMKIELGRKMDAQLKEAEEKREAEEARQKEEEARQKEEEARQKEEADRLATAALLIEQLNEPHGLKKFTLDLFGTSAGQMTLLLLAALTIVLAAVLLVPRLSALL